MGGLARRRPTPPGQIHHDIGSPMAELWGWDETRHPEYEYQPDSNAWIDLNCAFIIFVYEAFCATGDTAKLDYFRPFLKKAGMRMLNQTRQFGDTAFKYTVKSSVNTYDQPGIDVNFYNASLSTPTYQILSVFSAGIRIPLLKRSAGTHLTRSGYHSNGST